MRWVMVKPAMRPVTIPLPPADRAAVGVQQRGARAGLNDAALLDVLAASLASRPMGYRVTASDIDSICAYLFVLPAATLRLFVRKFFNHFAITQVNAVVPEA